MITVLLLLALLVLALGAFALPGRLVSLYIAVLSLAACALVLGWAISALFFDHCFDTVIHMPFAPEARLTIDRLSGFFVLLVSTVFVGTTIYNLDYYKTNHGHKSAMQQAFQLFNSLLMFLSVVFVLAARDAFVFLVAWELMTISAFLMMIYEGESRSNIKVATSFLIQMHVGFFLILLAFAMVEGSTGLFSFDALNLYFAQHGNLPVFLLFFAGFGLKAGFVPLHTWLPASYTTMPTNFSGMMSGVVTKMGIYGVIRVLTHVQSDLFTIAVIMLVVSMVSAVYGISIAAMHKDLKKMLAYSSIENMGIIGLSLSLGLIGQWSGNPWLTVAGYSGALLHILSHGVIKAMLFLSTGKLCAQIGTSNLEEMGGLIKLLPKSAMLFLVGATAICALPPFSGFVSEYIIYSAAIGHVSGSGYVVTTFSIIVIATLSVVGGMSLLAFGKAFGIGFLGTARSRIHAQEVHNSTLHGLWLLAGMVVLLGVAPALFVVPAYKAVGAAFALPESVGMRSQAISNLGWISLMMLLLIGLVAVLAYLRKRLMQQRQVSHSATWGCGATCNTARVQYTASSFSSEFAQLTQPITRHARNSVRFKEDEIFPRPRKLHSNFKELFGRKLLPRMNKIGFNLNKLAIFQTGMVHHYILYALLFMLIIFLLTGLGLI